MKSIEPELTVKLQARDGLNLHVAHWPSPQARGVVVFLHGLCAHGGWYGETAAHLRSAGWAMVAPDYRGHGLSDGPRAGLSKDDDLLFDASVVLDDVRTRYPGLPVVLMGHSTGGLVAARFGVEVGTAQPAPWSRPLDGLIMLAPALQATLSLTQKALLTTLGRLLLDVSLPVGIDPEWTCDDPQVIEILSADPLMHGRITPRFALFLARDGQRVLDHAHPLAMPALLLYSRADRLVMAEGCDRFAASAASPHLAVKAYQHLAHTLLQEPDKALVYQDVLAWLKQRFPW